MTEGCLGNNIQQCPKKAQVHLAVFWILLLGFAVAERVMPAEYLDSTENLGPTDTLDDKSNVDLTESLGHSRIVDPTRSLDPLSTNITDASHMTTEKRKHAGKIYQVSVFRCSGQGLKVIPEHIPTAISELYLDLNTITDIFFYCRKNTHIQVIKLQTQTHCKKHLHSDKQTV